MGIYESTGRVRFGVTSKEHRDMTREYFFAHHAVAHLDSRRGIARAKELKSYGPTA